MRRRSVCALVILLSLHTAAAQVGEWSQYKLQGGRLRDLGDYAGALSLYRKALLMAEQSGVSKGMLASSLNDLAVVCGDMGQYQEAEKHYTRALEVLEGTEGRYGSHYATVLSNLGTLYLQEGRLTEGEATLRTALERQAKVLPGDDLELAATRSSLAQSLLRRKQNKEGVRLLEEALAAYQKHPEASRMEAAIALGNLGVARRLTKRNAEGIPMLERANHDLEAELGTDHPVLIPSLNNLATAYTLERRMEDAGGAFRRALSICERKLGSEHPTYGAVLLNYAEFLKRMGQKKEAKATESQARAMLKASRRQSGAGMTVDVSAFRR